MTRRSVCHPFTGMRRSTHHPNNEEQLQQQPWRMSPTDQAAAETCLWDIVAASDSRMTGSRFTRLFSASKKKKLHSSFVLAGPFGLYLLNSCDDMGLEQKAAYGQVLIACNCLQRKHFTATQLQDTRGEVLLAVCMVEAYLPANELDYKLHLLRHLAQHIADTGPSWVTSMFVYESMWARLVDWATNMAAPELTLLRSFADYELAMFAYWRDPTVFNLPELQQFTQEFVQDAVHRYQLPISAPTDDTAVPEVQLKGLQNGRLDAQLRGRVRLALHQYYMEYEPGYLDLFKTFLHSWYQGLSAAQKAGLRIDRSNAHLLGYRCRISDLHQALNKWPEWVRQQQQQLQQAPDSGHTPAQLQQQEDLKQHAAWAESISNCSVWWYAEAVVGKTVRVVPVAHRRAIEFSWVLVDPSVAADEPTGSMTFMKVDMILQHTAGPTLCGEARGSEVNHTILFGDLHSSRNEAGGVVLHPFIGMPVLSATPDPNLHGILPTGFKVCVPCETARLSRMSMLPLLGEQDQLVCLTRHPQTLFEAAGLPTPF